MITRQNHTKWKTRQHTIFKDALEKMFKNKSYKELVDIHYSPARPSPRNHGWTGDNGLYRFLPWHRCFLLKFEEKLIAAQQDNGVSAADIVPVPYWRWTEEFPAWLDITSPYDPSSKPDRPRTSPNGLPTAADVRAIINDSYALPWESRYVCFTYAMEGLAIPANGFSLIRAHNHVHDWIGGIMGRVAFSPADPIFWLVHAEIDRLWHIWQDKFRAYDQTPPFGPQQHIMDPLDPPNTYDDLFNITTLGYEYDSLSYEEERPSN